MMFVYLISFFSLSFSSHVQELKIPQKIYDSIKANYKFEDSELVPHMTDVLVELKTAKGEFKLPVGYTLETLDLAQYLDKSSKSFEIQLSTVYDIGAGATTIYFISRYKPFKSISGKSFGYPCGTVYKIQERADEILNADPITVPVNLRTYVSVLGGDYLILHKESANKMRVSYFRIRDTRWTHEACPLDF